MRDRLDQERGVPLSPAGDKYFVDDHNMFIKVAAQPDVSAAYMVVQTRFRQPEFYVEATYNSLALEAASGIKQYRGKSHCFLGRVSSGCRRVLEAHRSWIDRRRPR